MAHGDRAGTTWSSGQELTFSTGKKVEADFLLWYQQKHRSSTDEPTEVVFGEAKSFGQDAFKDEDVERMKLLAEQYPGAALVFATTLADVTQQLYLDMPAYFAWRQEKSQAQAESGPPRALPPPAA
jgi:hypothetical protein